LYVDMSLIFAISLCWFCICFLVFPLLCEYFYVSSCCSCFIFLLCFSSSSVFLCCPLLMFLSLMIVFFFFGTAPSVFDFLHSNFSSFCPVRLRSVFVLSLLVLYFFHFLENDFNGLLMVFLSSISVLGVSFFQSLSLFLVTVVTVFGRLFAPFSM
jgi:hypothetical protein